MDATVGIFLWACMWVSGKTPCCASQAGSEEPGTCTTEAKISLPKNAQPGVYETRLTQSQLLFSLAAHAESIVARQRSRPVYGPLRTFDATATCRAAGVKTCAWLRGRDAEQSASLFHKGGSGWSAHAVDLASGSSRTPHAGRGERNFVGRWVGESQGEDDAMLRGGVER